MRIAFLGIGLMGDPMARRLLAAGHSVTVWNRTLAKAEALASAGALPAARLEEAVRDAGIVISMLEAGPVVAQVMRDALPALAPNALWVDMSSTQQAEAQAFHALLQTQGRRFIDAPVSGGVGGAAAGTLAIMAGKASCITCATMGPASSIEMTIPASCTASSSRATGKAPAGASASALEKVRFQTVTEWPTASRRRTIGSPIKPIPRNAIRMDNSAPGLIKTTVRRKKFRNTGTILAAV